MGDLEEFKKRLIEKGLSTKTVDKIIEEECENEAALVYLDVDSLNLKAIQKNILLDVIKEVKESKTKEKQKGLLRQMSESFSSFLHDSGLSDATATKLHNNECTSVESLKLLSQADVDSFELNKMQAKLLKKIIKDLNDMSVAAHGGIQTTYVNFDVGKIGAGAKAGLANVTTEGKTDAAGAALGVVKVKVNELEKEGEMMLVNINRKNLPEKPPDLDLSDMDLELTDGPVNVKVQTCSKEFFNQHREKGYLMDRKQRGQALVINVYSIPNKYPRDGTNIDRDKLQSLLQQMNFEVTVYNDQDGLKAAEIRDKLKKFAEATKSKDPQCVVVCLLTHGMKDAIYGTDDNIVPYEDIYKVFDNENCRHLIGRPKLFIFQACRGDEPDPGVKMTEQKDAGQVPTRTDMVMWFATQEGYAAFRSTKLGSWFIAAITEVFMAYAKGEEFSALVYRVNKLITAKLSLDKKSQTPECRHSMCKPLYFFPGQHL